MKRTFLSLCIATIAFFPTTGCGTLFFAERQNEEHSGKIDPNIVILDGIGLLFFIIPGLVAYGVDFYTGAIYLPEDVKKGEGPFISDPKEGDKAKKEEPPKEEEATPKDKE